MPESCPERDTLADYLSGRIDPAQGELLDSHLDHCDQCQTVLTACHAEEDTLVTALRQGVCEGEFDHEPQLRDTLRNVDRKRLREGRRDMSLTQLGPYRLIKLLGRGGMGEVYLAQHTRLEMTVAVKVLAERLLGDFRAIARFDREMKSVGQLDHPNIIRASDAGEVDGKHFLVMELVSGEDLAVIAQRRGPLAVADACEVVRQAAVGLQHACDTGLVHRDIKPANLMLNQRGCVKILDLGLALLDTPLGGDGAELTAAGQMMGTVDYMAPEQISDSHKVDIRADIYALGCTIYRLLSGAAPFQDGQYSNAYTKARAHCDTPPPPLGERRRDLPPALIKIVEKMLAKNPEDRWQSPADLAAALTPFTVGHDLPALLTESPTASVSSVDAEAPTSAYLTGAQHPSPSDRELALPIPQGSSTRKATRNKVTIAVMLCGGLLALLAMTMFIKTPAGTLRIEINDPEIELTVKGTQYVLKGVEQKDITLTPGDHILHIQRGDFEFDTKSLQLSKGDVIVVKVELIDGMIQVASNGQVLDSKSLSSVEDRDLPTTETNLAIAQWVHSLGGSIETAAGTFTPANSLPTSPFQITGISLHQREVGLQKITDVDIARFASLTQLKKLILDGAAITDQGAVQLLKNFPELEFLDIADTQISDAGFAEFGRLPKLNYLDVGGTSVREDGLVAIGQLQQLRHLDLARSKVTDAGLLHLKGSRISILFLQSTNISDAALESIATISQLKLLNLDSTEISDAGLFQLEPLQGLRDLKLRGAKASAAGVAKLQTALPNCKIEWTEALRTSVPLTPENDPIAMAQWVLSKQSIVIVAVNYRAAFVDKPEQLPTEDFRLIGINFTKPFVPTDEDFLRLRQSTTLNHLEFSDLELTERVVSQLAALPQLNLLRLRYDEAPPQRLERLAELPHLFDLTVGGEYVGDQEVAMLRGLKNAFNFTISGKRVTDAGLVHLSELTQVQFLSLIFTRVEGPGLVHLKRLPKLWSLQLPYTPLNDTGAEPIAAMSEIKWLNLSFSQIGDETLKQIARMPMLENLELVETKVTNAGIAFLQPIASLRSLHVATPQVDDGAVDVLSKLTQLTTLSVGNRLSADSVKILRTRLPNCRIVSDVVPDD